ncbi:MAG: chemotaxis protein CheW [Spirochaetales bacterium]|nr:MAG: chemotaxis protein CheW [Spirochaetales bacterium]
MAEKDATLQLVTFQLGQEHYGVDIMEVDGIVREDNIRSVPNVPPSVEGIFNLRGKIIPVINLHRRFHLRKAELSEEDQLLGGLVILNINDMLIGVIIDKISRVVTIERNKVQPPPQMISGIGAEYIKGVAHEEGGYLIILDIHRLFDPREIRQLGNLAK